MAIPNTTFKTLQSFSNQNKTKKVNELQNHVTKIAAAIIHICNANELQKTEDLDFVWPIENSFSSQRAVKWLH